MEIKIIDPLETSEITINKGDYLLWEKSKSLYYVNDPGKDSGDFIDLINCHNMIHFKTHLKGLVLDCLKLRRGIKKVKIEKVLVSVIN